MTSDRLGAPRLDSIAAVTHIGIKEVQSLHSFLALTSLLLLLAQLTKQASSDKDFIHSRRFFI